MHVWETKPRAQQGIEKLELFIQQNGELSPAGNFTRSGTSNGDEIRTGRPGSRSHDVDRRNKAGACPAESQTEKSTCSGRCPSLQPTDGQDHRRKDGKQRRERNTTKLRKSLRMGETPKGIATVKSVLAHGPLDIETGRVQKPSENPRSGQHRRGKARGPARADWPKSGLWCATKKKRADREVTETLANEIELRDGKRPKKTTKKIGSVKTEPETNSTPNLKPKPNGKIWSVKRE
jgi:hypothetical protein